MTQLETAPAWREVAATGQLVQFVVLCLGVWLHAADSLLVATVMPQAVAQIGGVHLINWTLALYQLGSILAAAVTAPLASRIGLRAVLMLAASLYAVGCAASALAPEIATMLVGRLLQGLGGGSMAALVYVAICELFPERLWPRLMAIASTIWGGSALCGPLVGGLFAEAGMWRGAFWAFAGQAVLVIIAAAFQPSRPAAARGGWAPAPLGVLIISAICVATAGATIGTWWPAPLAVGGLALLFLFARLDARQPHRLLPASALDLRRPAGSGLLTIFALAVATMPFSVYGPLLLGLGFGIGPLAAGYLVAAEAIAWTLASIASSGANVRTEPRLIGAGVSLVALGAIGYALAVPAGSIVGILACIIAQGAGFGMAKARIVTRIAASVPEAERGRAAASGSTAQTVGYAMGAAASGIAANAAGLDAGLGPAAAQSAGFWVFTAFVPVALLALFAARRLTAASNRCRS
jgi:MFS family permease